MSLITVQKYMPDDLPMIDDNSDLTLLGYKNILIEPQVPVFLSNYRSFNTRTLCSVIWKLTAFLCVCLALKSCDVVPAPVCIIIAAFYIFLLQRLIILIRLLLALSYSTFNNRTLYP